MKDTRGVSKLLHKIKPSTKNISLKSHSEPNLESKLALPLEEKRSGPQIALSNHSLVCVHESVVGNVSSSLLGSSVIEIYRLTVTCTVHASDVNANLIY